MIPALLLAGALLAAPVSPPAAGAWDLEIVPLKPGLWLIRRPEVLRQPVEPNVLVIVNERDVVVVDGGGIPRSAANAIALIKSVTKNPVSTLVNTHWSTFGWNLGQGGANNRNPAAKAIKDAGGTFDTAASIYFPAMQNPLNHNAPKMQGKDYASARVDWRPVPDLTLGWSLGLVNGDLFSSVIAFSPGFATVPLLRDSPRVFIAHGTGDQVLPIENSRSLVPALRGLGLSVEFLEFAGGHTVTYDVARAALTWFVSPAPMVKP